MNYEDVVKTVADRLGQRKGIDDQIGTEMRIVQQTVLEGGDFLPWFLVSDPVEVETDAIKLTLPPGFLREYDGGALWAQDGQGVWRLAKVDFEELDVRCKGKKGKPTAYALGPTAAWLGPQPQTTYTFYWMVYRKEPKMEEGNKWLEYAPDWVIAETLVRMGMRLQMQGEFVQEARQEAKMAKRRLMTADTARDAEGREVIFGGR